MTIEEAKKMAILEGKKITHNYFLPSEYLHYKDGIWFTEEGYEVPYHYWIGLVPEMLIGWEEF